MGAAAGLGVIVTATAGGVAQPCDFPFTTPQYVGCGETPRLVDLDGDGLVDVVDYCRALGVTVRFGAGGRELEPPIHSPASTNEVPFALELADFDEDGVLDVVVSRSDEGLFVFLGDGTGSFSAEIPVLAGGQMYNLGVGDLNGDGHADVVISDWGNSEIHVLTGLGDASFTVDTIEDTFRPGAVHIVDINMDGDADLVVGSESAEPIEVRLGNGDGTFGEKATYGEYEPIYAIASRDFDGDGRMDLAIVSQVRVEVYLGQEGGELEAFWLGLGPAVPLRDIAVGDVTGDGVDDIVVACDSSQHGLTLFAGNGDGTFADFIEPGVLSATVDAADFDDNGIQDLYVTSDWTYAIILDSDEHTRDVYATTPGSDSRLIGGDFNDDGFPDVVVAGSSLVIHLGDGAGFGPSTVIRPNNDLLSLAVEDVTGDGHLDLLAAGDKMAVLYPGAGDGSFMVEQLLVEDNFAADHLATGDLNGDDLVDVVVTGHHKIWILSGVQGGGLTEPFIFDLGFQTPSNVSVGDINGDGLDDIAFSLGGNYDQVCFLVSKAGGGFYSLFHLAVGTDVFDVKIGDFDGDGDGDLVIKWNGASGGAALENLGGAVFADPEGFAPWNDGSIGDVTGDGADDFALAYGPLGGVGVMSVHDQWPIATIGYGPGDDHDDTALLDVNADGRLDVVAALSNDRLLAVYINRCPPDCPADLNGDGRIDVLDFVAFQLAWQAQEPIADCDASGGFDVLDFVCFQQVFMEGCP